MIDSRRYLVHDLPEWFEIATKELAPFAQERVRSEIEAHYTEGVAAHLAEGLSESDARRDALADLGSPDEAAKRFRKHHLTTKDAEHVKRVFGHPKRGLLYSYLSFCACGLWGYFYLSKLYILSFAVLLFLGLVATVILPTLTFIVMRSKSKNIGFFILADGVSSCALMGWLYYSLVRMSKDWGFAAICFLALILTVLPILRTRLKLRNVANVWDEIPPQNK